MVGPNSRSCAWVRNKEAFLRENPLLLGTGSLGQGKVRKAQSHSLQPLGGGGAVKGNWREAGKMTVQF